MYRNSIKPFQNRHTRQSQRANKHKHTSCSLYFLKCCFLNVFSYFFMQPERVKDAHDLN